MRVTWSNIAGPKLQRNGAWWATFAGLVAYLAWQSVALLVATLVFFGRASGRCLIGPECTVLAGTSDGFAGFLALAAIALSIGILPALAKLTLAFWRQAYWTGVVLRVVGMATAVAGLLGFLLDGLVWAAIGAWIAFWSRRLTWQTPADAGRPTGDPNVLEGERV